MGSCARLTVRATHPEASPAAATTGAGAFSTTSLSRICMVIFLAALASAAWQMTLPAPFGFGGNWETVTLARNIAAGNGFSSPFGALQTGPTAHVAPVFPLILAALIRIFGDTPTFALAALVLCAFAHAFYCVLFIPLSSLLFCDRTPGIWAAIFCALVPTFEVVPQWETIYAALAGQLFCLAAARLRRGNHSWIAGALCGMMLLVNPALVFVALAWLVYMRPSFRWLASFAFAAGLVCLPWTTRNYRELGSVFFVRDNLGSELYVSNSDCSDARDSVNFASGCHNLHHPNLNRGEASAVRDLGEAAYNRARMVAAIEWISTHPARFTRLTLARIREFWFPSPGSMPIREYSGWLITVLSILGLANLVRLRRRAAWFPVSAMALYPVVYYLVQASPRYRAPILWIMVLPAAFAATRVIATFRPATTISETGRNDLPPGVPC